MARPFRVEYEGAIYHITSRGNERRDIYLDDRDREHFVELLMKGSDLFQVDIISYCMMPNHYHLLIKTREANLSRFMQRLNVSYTMYFNTKHQRVGHLLQGRYKAIVVGSDEYFLTLSRYIHLNPVNTQMNRDKSKEAKEDILRNYKWSSYLSVLDPRKRSPFLKCEAILEYKGGDTANGRRKYQVFINSELGKETKSPFSDLKHQLILGDDEFTEWIKEKFIKDKELKPYTHLRNINEYKDINRIAEIVAQEYGLKAEDILKPRSKHMEARSVLIEIAYTANIRKKSLKEIANEIGCSSSAAVSVAHNRVQNRISTDDLFKKRVDKIRGQVLTSN